MKILFTIKAINDIKGGAERVLADIANGLEQKGHDISLLSFDKPDDGEPFYRFNDTIKHLNLGLGDVKKPSGVFETLKRMIALRKTIKDEKPDIVVAFMHSIFIPASLAMIGTGTPLIASEHIVPQHYKNRKLDYFLLLVCGPLAKKITVLSDKVRDMYPKFLHERMVAMPNPVSVPAQKSDVVTPINGRRTILNIGRMTDQKDQKTLIAAFAKIAQKFPDWDVVIIGEGELENDLRAQIKSLKLEDRILLPGTTKEIDKAYLNAHIFALPSLYESFGLVTVEAMSFGLPVLGFDDCPGTNEIVIHQKNGMLVSGKNREESFATGLGTLIEDAEKRISLGQKGIKTAANFSPKKIIQRWEDLILACAE